MYRTGHSADGRAQPFTEFLDDFSAMLASYVLHPSRLLVTGDFNIWMDDKDDSSTVQFSRLLQAYGMIQHVHCATHRLGHTLDL